MKGILKTVVLSVLLATSLTVYGQKSEEKLVRKSFDNYKSAILNDQGEEAVKYVDSRTIKYYSEILEQVKTADSLKVESLSILDKLMVFSIRHRTSKDDILSFDGKSLLIYAIKSGMVGKNSVANNSIGDIIIENDFAKGQFLFNGRKAPVYFHFYKEVGLWKIDLTSLFPLSESALEGVVEANETDSTEYIFSILEQLTGNRPGSEIWQPVNL